ncbi:MAG: HAMP domain-containing histidine kinase [Lachnospiraceae bacterium]|nr:HAMP domain-containing histidine kinase [Lachnospiraceae bacterium]
MSFGMKLLTYYMKRNLRWIGILLLNLFSMTIIIELNGIAYSEWAYGGILCLFFIFVVGGIDFIIYYRRHEQLIDVQKVIRISVDALELPSDQIEEDYQRLLQLVHEDKIKAVNRLENRKKDLTEYYTMWVHQIKTPIAAIRLLLQEEETPQNMEIESELFRVEQYVEMALHYTRLDSDSTDFIIQKHSLDTIVREAVHKYAKIFIRKKIRLNYKSLDTQIVTDEKWLEFVIEQVLSNALKYTQKGIVSIYMEGENTVVIEDTGIGIRAEDLPRACEKGYTGYNGHTDKRSTGIGLYLCKRILEKLSHTIEIESEIGVGTRVKIGLITEDRIHE